MGGYLDLLTKELIYEFTHEPKARISSLGANAKRLLECKNIPPEVQEIAQFLKKYDDFLYNLGKHNFNVPQGRRHRFTGLNVERMHSREIVGRVLM